MSLTLSTLRMREADDDKVTLEMSQVIEDPDVDGTAGETAEDGVDVMDQSWNSALLDASTGGGKQQLARSWRWREY
jgi:hypothetical protein